MLFGLNFPVEKFWSQLFTKLEKLIAQLAVLKFVLKLELEPHLRKPDELHLCKKLSEASRHVLGIQHELRSESLEMNTYVNRISG